MLHGLRTPALHQQKIIQQCEREGLPLPKGIARAPELFQGLEVYLVAFWDLTTTRNNGMGLVPISWSAVHAYSEASGLDLDDLLYFIRALDQAYLAYKAEQGAKKSGSKR